MLGERQWIEKGERRQAEKNQTIFSLQSNLLLFHSECGILWVTLYLKHTPEVRKVTRDINR